jgi:hypothetical protein
MFGFQEAFKMTEFTCEQAVGRISPHRYPFFRQSVRRNQRQRRITVYAAAQPERSCEGNKRVIIQKPLITSGFVAQTSPLAENWLCLAQSADFQASPVFSTRWASFRIFLRSPSYLGNLALLVKFLSQPQYRS